MYIPLSSDETSLSSLLLVSVDVNNEVSVVRDYNTNYLKNYVYNTENPKGKRKFLMDTFMQMDFLTFGQQRFTNLPLDLYEGAGIYNRINLTHVENQSFNNGKFLYETLCATLHACANDCPLTTCDYNNCDHHGLCWYIDFGCNTTSEWVDDPSGSGLPPGGTIGGGGGASGCNTCPSNTPPKDDCAMLNVFYRMKPECNSGTGDGGELPLEDPCLRILSENIKARDLLNINTVKKQDSIMKIGIASASVEKGFIFGKDSIGNYQTSGIFVGATNS